MEQFPSPFVVNPDFVQKVMNVFKQTISTQQEQIAALIANTNDINCKLSQMQNRLDELNANNERSHNNISDILSEIKDIKSTLCIRKDNTNGDGNVNENNNNNIGITDNDVDYNDTQLSNQQHKQIQKIEKYNLDDLHSKNVFSITLMNDNRIITGSFDGSLSINTINYDKRTYHKDIYMQHAHDDMINSIHSLNETTLLTCSDDKTIKVWNVSQTDLTHIKTISSHSDYVFKLITLSKSRFASCSGDRTIKIWKDSSPYDEIATLNHGGSVFSIIQLKNTDTLVACGNSSSGLSFWNCATYTRIHIIKKYGGSKTGMIQINESKFAVSSDSKVEGYPILIIDTKTFEIEQKIKIDGYITHHSSLCMLDEGSFVYVYEGKIVQISCKDYNVVFKSYKSGFNGLYGVVSVDKGKHLVVDNDSEGVTVVVPVYDDRTEN